MDFSKSNKGYTMIELLTVIGILVVVSGIIAGVFYSTLRGTSKAKITTTVAQNGNYALSVISNVIIASNAVTAIGQLTQTSDPPFTDCTASPIGQSIDLRGADGTSTTLSCNGGVDGTISSGSASLIDNTQVKINTTDSANCYFKCIQSANNSYNIPVIEVGFTLSDKQSSNSFFENKSSGIFKTSVSLRNYTP